MKHDHLMGWPAALLCIDEPEKRVEAKPVSKPVPWKWVEFEKGNFDLEAPEQEYKEEDPFPNFNLGDEVLVMTGDSWLKSGIRGTIEEQDRYIFRISIEPKDAVRVWGAYENCPLGRTKGRTVSWWKCGKDLKKIEPKEPAVPNFAVGDKVMVTGKQEWIAVGAFGVVEEGDSGGQNTYYRISVHESQSINIGGFETELGKQFGFTVSWWIQKDCLRKAGNAFPFA